jgi:hypothetical protein
VLAESGLLFRQLAANNEGVDIQGSEGFVRTVAGNEAESGDAAALRIAQDEAEGRERRLDAFSVALITGLTLITVLIHGYHPYAEDGGIYLPGIFKLLDPKLYPRWSEFVTAQARYSLFARFVAGVVRLTGLSVMTCILGVYCAGIWTTLYAGWRILGRCCRSREGCFAGMSILALCMTLPIAGTSLILVDPYVTARSISTPCSLLAIAGALDVIAVFKRSGRVRLRRALLCAGSLSIAALMHPLMGAYAGGSILLLACCSISRVKLRATAIGGIAALSVCFACVLKLAGPAEPSGYAAIARTRYYWFLSRWQWYEIAGLIAPLFLLLALSRYTRFKGCAIWLSRMAMSAGLIGLIVSLLFVRESGPSYSIAMLQPLRIFQIVYVVMILLMSVVVAEVFLKRDPLRWGAALLPLGALMMYVQVQTYPHSPHLELPWTVPGNDWERGFLWIRDNTPVDAAFALDAKYILRDGEDAQNFRAIARRSSLPDYQKDGGIAAIEPDLTSEWITGQSIQNDLASSSDGERRAKLGKADVQWFVLPDISTTGFPCAYRNSSMKVCRIPER